jgi:hypothetical protein
MTVEKFRELNGKKKRKKRKEKLNGSGPIVF